MPPKPLILDCDPGHDDAIAMLVAGASPELDLRAVTTVGGNQDLDKCTRNACRVLTVCGLHDVPVAAGAAAPLTRRLRVADDIHGESGLDGPQWPEPTVRPVSVGAVELIRRTLTESTEPVTLVATGPLTNIATVLRAYPELVPRIRAISWMGGSTDRGNVTPYAEFNAMVDPEAVAIVFNSGVDVTMIGLNVTHRALVTDDVITRLRTLGTTTGTMAVDLMTFFATTYRDVYGFSAPPLHDPIAVVHVLGDELISTVEANVEVETAGIWTAGATVVDLDGYTGRDRNIRVAVGLDTSRFWDLIVNSIGAYD